MNILDLWAGTGSATKAFKDAGHNVITVDYDSQHNPTICKDILDVTVEELQKFGSFDYIHAGPDCRVFSIANLHSRNFIYDGDKLIVNTEKAKEAIKRVKHTLFLIHALKPKFWTLENPRAMLRKLPFMKHYERKTISYCQYEGNRNRMKPTDIWGVFPSTFDARFCKNGASCHSASPRGSNTGTQALPLIQRSMMPIGFSKEMLKAVEDGKKYITLEAFL